MNYLWNNLIPNPIDPGEDESPHYPFKRRAKIGPGPMKETNRRVGNWDCLCEDYVCVCAGISDETRGKRRIIRTDPERKKAYNKIYRAWLKKRRRR